MNIIISKDLMADSFSHFKVYKSIEKAIEENQSIGVLVIHNSEEDEFKVGLAVSEAYKRGTRSFVYINEHPLPSIMSVMVGVQGIVLKDEFYFEEELELMEVLKDNDIDTSDTDIALGSAQIVKDFIGAFVRGEERVNTEFYLEQVTRAVNELGSLVNAKDLQVTEMGVSAMDTFKKASETITAMRDTNIALTQKLAELEDSKSVVRQQQKSQDISNTVWFPTVPYRGMAKVLFIRELSPCRYLTWFLYTYMNYLRFNRDKRVKLVIAIQRGKGVLDKYNDDEVRRVTSESLNMSSPYDGDIIVTNVPKKDVMDNIFSKDADVFIVLDRLYGSSDIIDTTGSRVSKLYACSGYSDVSRYKVSAKKCIFPITEQRSEFFHIPLMSPFPPTKEGRSSAYFQNCQKQFQLLDTLI